MYKGSANFRISLLWVVIPVLAMSSTSLFGQGRYGYVYTGYNYTVSVVDINTQTVVTNINTSYYATAGALNQTGTKVWITGGNYLSVYSTATRSLLYQFPYNGYTYSRPMFSFDGSKAYVLRSNYPMNLVSYDTATYARVDSVSITGGGSSLYAQPILSPDGRKLYYVDSYTLYEVNVSTGSVVRTLSFSGSSPRDLKLSPDGASIYLLAGNSISKVSVSTLTVSSILTCPSSSPSLFALNRDGTRLFVADNYSYTLRVFTLPAGTYSDYTLNTSYAQDIALAPSDSLIYIVHNNYSNNISIFNLKTNSTIRTLSTSSYPVSMSMPLPSDGVPPAPVAGFQLAALSYDKAQITMTASGDDSLTGRASFYQIRYDTVQLTTSNFDQATIVNGIPRPSLSGHTDTVVVSNLRGGKTYYFGVKVGDELLNLSTLVVNGVLLPLPPRITVQPDSLLRTMSDNDSVNLSFTVLNTGGSNLAYRVFASSMVRQEENSVQGSGLALSRKIIGVVGNYGIAAADYYNQDSVLSRDFLFSGVGDNWTFSQISGFDGILVEETDYGLTLSEAQALEQVYNSGKPIVFGMDDMDNVPSSVQSIIYGIFGVQNAQDGVFQPGQVNPSHPISQGVTTLGVLSDGDNDHFDANGADWVARGSDGYYYAFARSSGRVRTVLFGEYVAQWFASVNAQLVRNAFRWAYTSGGLSTSSIDVLFDPDSGSIPVGGQQNVQVVIKTKDFQAGNYLLNVGLESSDPDNALKVLPLYLTISRSHGAPSGDSVFPERSVPPISEYYSGSSRIIILTLSSAGCRSRHGPTSIDSLGQYGACV